MRKPAALITVLALTVGAAVSFAATPASATSAGVAFSAEDLPTWQTDGIVYALASVQGAVVAGGTFTSVKPPEGAPGAALAQSTLVILDAETGSPTQCQFPVTLAGGAATVRAAVAAPDGRTVYIGGNFSSVGGVSALRVARIDPIACTVLPFQVQGITSFVHGLAVTSTTVYMAGEFRSVDGQTRERFAAVDATTGALLPWSPSADGIGRAVAVSPDGRKVAVGGEFTQLNAHLSRSIAVVDATTGRSVKLYGGMVQSRSATKSIASDGTQFYVGNEGTGGNVFDGRFAVNWSTLEQTWKDGCLGATQAVLPYQGTLYVASHAHNCSPNANEGFQDGRRNFFLAEGTEQPNILGWYPTASDGIGEGIGPRALAVAVGSTTGTTFLWSGGEFTLINGRPQQSLTRFGPNDLGAPPAPVLSVDPVTSAAIQVRFQTVVDRDDSALTYRIYRNDNATPIWTGTATSFWWSRPQVTFVDSAVTPGSTYSYRVTASDGVNTSPLSGSVATTAVVKGADYPSTVIADSPVLYWRMNETGSIKLSGSWSRDQSGATTSGLNGLFQGGVTLGRAGAIVNDADTSAQFDGSTGYVWSDQQRPSPTTYSVEAWFKTTTSRGGKIIGYGNGRPRTDTYAANVSTSYDKQVYMDNTGRLNFGVKASGATQVLRTGAALNDNAWHHVVATQGPGGMRLYVDGALAAQNVVTGNEQYYGNWHVGGDRLTGWPNNPTSGYFAGQIDEVAVYAAPLSAQQVANHNSLARSGVVPPPPADTTAPSTPGSVAAAATPTGVDVTWSTSADNVGVAGYRVYRGTSSSFVADASTQVAEVPGTSFADPVTSAGTYYYRIAAFDAAGNQSVASTPASVTLSPRPVTLTVTPSEDARTVKITPTTNYGADTQLSATGDSSSSPAASYLRFALPAAPTGTHLTGATLSIRTSADSSAGSIDSQNIATVTGDWSQSTVTWNTRPVGAGVSLGTLTGATAVNTTYATALDVAALANLAGSSTAFSVTGTGNDNLRFWSSEYTAAPPTLALTYSPN